MGLASLGLPRSRGNVSILAAQPSPLAFYLASSSEVTHRLKISAPRQRVSQPITIPGNGCSSRSLLAESRDVRQEQPKVATAQSALNYLGDEGARVVAVLRSRSNREEVRT